MPVLLVLTPLLLLLPGRAPLALDPPTGAEVAVIRVDSSAGMGTRESFFVQGPDVVLAGDGTGYRDGEHGLEVFHVDDATLVGWLREADDSGLLDRAVVSRSADGLMDAGTTSLDLDAGTVQRHHEVYGLGERSGFGGLSGYVHRLVAWADRQPATPYVATAYRVLTRSADGTYHCEVSATAPHVAGPIVAFAPLLPGDRCLTAG